MRTPLESLNNCRKSFYGKATTEQNGTVVCLYSYDTKVATYDKQTDTLYFTGSYSRTTVRHLLEFCVQQVPWFETWRLMIEVNERINSAREFFDRVQSVDCTNHKYTVSGHTFKF